jgi:glycosyltransferase involved in cell wall biosynthesis
MENFVFSVIIPHKNIPDLLQRCLDSIPRRDDIQILVVDDNSDETLLDFSLFPGLNDSHVEVYLTKEGKGAGYARNIGLAHAKGQWLLFADADDFFTDNAFEHFFAHKDSPHELIYFKVTSCYSDTGEPADRSDCINPFVENCFYHKRDSENRLRYRHHHVPWGKMVNAALVRNNNIRFEEVVAHNDTMFAVKVGCGACSIAVVNTPVYCVTVRKGSIHHSSSYEGLLSRYLVTLRMNRFLREKRKHKYQSPTIHYVFASIKYGIVPFLYFIRLSIQYRNNPFIDLFNVRCIKAYFKVRKGVKANRRYFVYE